MNYWKFAFFVCLAVLALSHGSGIISAAETFKSSRELQKPPIANQNDNSVEVLRVWADPKGDNQFVIEPLWNDAGSWGILLVDIARHAANAHAKKYGGEPKQALARIGQVFTAEWKQPTSPANQIQ